MARQRLIRAFVLLAGLVLPQFYFFGPALLGQKVLLPLDVLAGPHQYIVPPKPEHVVIHSLCFSDFVTHNEPDRRFAAQELAAGRLPLWNPYIFGGTPFVIWPKFAPHSLLYCLFPTPYTLAWLQLLKSICAGVGAYFFFLRVLGVQLWPALVGAWCYPLTSYFLLWQGAVHTYAMAGFPWLLLATDSVIGRPGSWGGPALALLTCLIIISSSVDFSALTLLASGLFALWRLSEVHGGDRSGLMRAAALLTLGWGLGIALALPYVLPLAQYAAASAEVARRAAGQEPRMPVPLDIALAQIVLPRSHGPFGTPEAGFLQMFGGAVVESAAATYSGLLATLWLAPLAWLSRRQRWLNLLWLTWIVVGLGWQLNLPGIVHLMRLPFVKVLPFNRFVFIASFGITALAVVGMDVVLQGVKWQRWGWLFAALLSGISVWCLWGACHWPEPVATQIERSLEQGVAVPGIPDMAGLRQCQRELVLYRLLGACLCGVALAAWVLSAVVASRRVYYVLTALWLLELLVFGFQRTPQADPALYYPDLAILEELKRGEPGRILGVGCFPANYAQVHGIHDIRGYDGMAPARLAELLEVVREGPPNMPMQVHTQWIVPFFLGTDSGALRTVPILSMLGVRYLLAWMQPIPGLSVKMRGDGFWVHENSEAVPRVFVPREIKVADQRELLALLAAPDFQPRRLAYLDRQDAAATAGDGEVKVVAEIPTEVTVAAQMKSAGLVILADRWDADWHCYVDNAEVPLLRVNHVLRGVQVQPGRHQLVFRYEPSGLYAGLRWAGLALGTLLVWGGSIVLRSRWTPP